MREVASIPADHILISLSPLGGEDQWLLCDYVFTFQMDRYVHHFLIYCGPCHPEAMVKHAMQQVS